jgi:hypothetical protein
VREWSPGSLLNSPFSNGEMQGKTAWDVDEWKSITDEIQVLLLVRRSTALASRVRDVSRGLPYNRHACWRWIHCCRPPRQAPRGLSRRRHAWARIGFQRFGCCSWAAIAYDRLSRGLQRTCERTVEPHRALADLRSRRDCDGGQHLARGPRFAGRALSRCMRTPHWDACG